jgi:predicted O-linked N-acetylglucosamine transferase (SPINDLY family)
MFQIATSFAQLVAEAEPYGANCGNPKIIGLYREWIAAQPTTHPHLHAAWFNLGVELNSGGDPDAAAQAYRIALAHQPCFAPAAVNLGLLLERNGDAAAALRVWAQATQPDEARTSLLNHRARLKERSGQFEEAETLLRASLHTQPNQPDVIQHWIHLRQKMCSWPVLSPPAPGLTHADLVRNCGPLAALALFDDVATQTEIGAAWVGRKTLPVPVWLTPAGGYAHTRLRIGYLSSDFCRHAMSFLIAELFERHDRTRFEIYGYCASPEDGSELRARVLAAFDHRRSITAVSDERAAQMIRADEIDILIDLNGLTQGSRLQILRHRPAPVQATYLGFVGPVPVPELDYLFCDATVIPHAVVPAYRPAPIYIAANYQANDTRRPVPRPASRAEAGLPEGGFVFCCFSNHYKITQELFGAWMEILRRSPGSYLWLIADNIWSRASLLRETKDAGIDPARLLFAERVDPTAYLGRLAAADLFLDTFPYNAGTIASDAIRMGLPLLTRAGESFASRMATSLLTTIGATGGISENTQEYIEKAASLAGDPGAYADYKRQFGREVWANTLGDIAGLTTSFEATLERIAVRQGEGLPTVEASLLVPG